MLLVSVSYVFKAVRVFFVLLLDVDPTHKRPLLVSLEYLEHFFRHDCWYLGWSLILGLFVRWLSLEEVLKFSPWGVVVLYLYWGSWSKGRILVKVFPKIEYKPLVEILGPLFWNDYYGFFKVFKDLMKLLLQFVALLNAFKELISHSGWKICVHC